MNPFGMNRGQTPQASVGIMQNAPAQHAQMSQEPGIMSQIGDEVVKKGINKGSGYLESSFKNGMQGGFNKIGADISGILSPAAAPVATAAAPAATSALAGAAAPAVATGLGGLTGAAGTGMMAAAAPMAAPLLLGGLMLSKLFK